MGAWHVPPGHTAWLGLRGGGRFPAGRTLQRPQGRSQLCHSVMEKWPFRLVTTDSPHGSRAYDFYVYFGFKWDEHDNRQMQPCRHGTTLGRPAGRGLGAQVCRFAIDLTTKRASHRFPRTLPAQVRSPIPPTGQSDSLPGGYRSARPGCAPTHPARLPDRRHGIPPAVPVQKGAIETPTHRLEHPSASPGEPDPHMAATSLESFASPHRRPPRRRCSRIWQPSNRRANQ
jgi:hypothetical protein